jgi:integrase
MASIRKHRNKWQAQVRRTGYPALVRSFIHKADAQAWARRSEQRIDSGDLMVDQRALKVMTVGDLLVRYKNTITPTKRGAGMERYKVDAFLSHPIAASTLRSFTPLVVASYRDERLRQVKPGTVRRELSVLHHCIEIARKEWGLPLPVNPVGRITLPKTSEPRNRRPTLDEIDNLLSGCRQCRSPVLGLIIQFAIETGMRRGELVSARWSDVDLESRTLHIPISKNGHSRTIPLTPNAVSLLGTLSRQSDHIFQMSGNAIRLAWERLKKRVGITDLRFHDLRHEAVSRFFEMGLTVPEVALISGHRDARMLFRYTHLRAEDVAIKLGQVGQPGE